MLSYSARLSECANSGSRCSDVLCRRKFGTLEGYKAYEERVSEILQANTKSTKRHRAQAIVPNARARFWIGTYRGR